MNSDFRTKILRTRVVADQAAMKRRKGIDPVIDAQAMRTSEGLSQQLRMGRRCHARLADLKFEPSILVSDTRDRGLWREGFCNSLY